MRARSQHPDSGPGPDRPFSARAHSDTRVTTSSEAELAVACACAIVGARSDDTPAGKDAGTATVLALDG